MLVSNSRPQAILLPQTPYQYVQGPLNNVHRSECVYPSIPLPHTAKYYESVTDGVADKDDDGDNN